jgi:2-polyprenyl-3-methyl-5-hydroxy-6-metoxy-1,4-benzoquinol methylase
VTEVDPRWYDGFFEAERLDYVQPEDDVTRRQSDFVVEELGLMPGNAVLDVACGRGRHSVELARRGLRFTGIDLSPRSLEHARAAADRAGVVLEFRRLDMREIDRAGRAAHLAFARQPGCRAHLGELRSNRARGRHAHDSARAQAVSTADS